MSATGRRGQTDLSILTEVTEAFLLFLLVEKGASSHTALAYRNDLRGFAKYVAGGPRQPRRIGWRDVDKATVEGFIAELKERGYMDSSIVRKAAAVRSFFAFLVTEGIVGESPGEGLSLPQVRRPTPLAIPPDALEELLKQPARRSTPGGKRDQAMLELLYATGMRVGELVSLDVTSFQGAPSPTIRCPGRGSKQRTIPIQGRAIESLRTYLQEARPLLLHGNASEAALFVNRLGRRLSRQGFWLILKGYVRAAGLASEIAPSTLRTSFAARMLGAGMSLRNVQRLLGHARINTTRAYSDLVRNKAGP